MLSSKEKKYEMTKQERKMKLIQEVANDFVNESYDAEGNIKKGSFIDLFKSGIETNVKAEMEKEISRGTKPDQEKHAYIDYARQKQSDKVLMELALNILENYSVNDFFKIVDKCVDKCVNKTDLDDRPWDCGSSAFFQQYFDAYSKNFISQLTIAMNELEENKKIKGGVKDMAELAKENGELIKENMILKDGYKTPDFMKSLLSQPKVLKALRDAIKATVTPDKTPVVQGTLQKEDQTTSPALLGKVIPEAKALFEQQVVVNAVDSALANNATILATIEASVYQSICNNKGLIQDLKKITKEEFDNKIEPIIAAMKKLLESPPEKEKKDGGQKTRKRKNKSIKNIYIK